jgi:hypothetical protein
MPRKPETPTPDSVEETTDVQHQQRGRHLMVAHRRLKIAFADIYVAMEELREENARLNEIIQEQQRVMGEMSAKLPTDEPKKAAPKS